MMGFGPAIGFQWRVHRWMLDCFGARISSDPVERNHRFLEESLELVQALGCSKAEALQLVEYVYGRPKGEPVQEVGGVMVTLAALCHANGMSMDVCAEEELVRICGKIEEIRAKQAQKPKFDTRVPWSHGPKYDRLGDLVGCTCGRGHYPCIDAYE